MQAPPLRCFCSSWQARRRLATTPANFVWGTDGTGPAPTTNSNNICPSNYPTSPWSEPDVENTSGCGQYGAYFGEVGGYYNVLSGCSGTNYLLASGARDASDNYATGANSGFMPYFDLGGPGMDPNYNGTTSEAAAWGERQGKAAVKEVEAIEAADGYFGAGVIAADVEAPSQEGWNDVNAPGCGAPTKTTIQPNVDMAVINGFNTGVLTQDGSTGIWDPAIYVGSVSTYPAIFGSQSYNLPDMMVYVSDWGPNCANPAPYGFSQSSSSCTGGSWSPPWPGQYNGSSHCALAWQWASVDSHNKDYDQFDANNVDYCIPS